MSRQRMRKAGAVSTLGLPPRLRACNAKSRGVVKHAPPFRKQPVTVSVSCVRTCSPTRAECVVLHKRRLCRRNHCEYALRIPLRIAHVCVSVLPVVVSPPLAVSYS